LASFPFPTRFGSQAAEHLAALDAFGVRHAVVAVTRSDLADPEPMRRRAAAAVGSTGMAGAEVVAVSARTGTGLGELRAALLRMLTRLPPPDPAADVRMWVDRAFTLPGAGTVVTGTLPAGTVAVGDTLVHDDEPVRVRGVQTLGTEVGQASGVARVALRLGGRAPAGLRRGSVLVTPGAWHSTDVVDVRLSQATEVPERPVLHVGAAALGCHCRPLGADAARLRLDRPLPLRVGDRLLLRDPGSARIWGATALDPSPPPLRRRGQPARRAARLARTPDQPDLADELDRRGFAEVALLRRIGVPVEGAAQLAVDGDGWLLDIRLVPELRRRLQDLVTAHHREQPLSPGLPQDAAARALGLPSTALLRAVAPEGLLVRDGRLVPAAAAAEVPERLEAALRRLHADLAGRPFLAPEASRLLELGLDRRAVAAAERAGRLLRLTDTVVLLPGADVQAAGLLAELPQPFTAGQARAHLGTTRRVALPLLALLDRRGFTVRLPDDRRRVLRTR
jgi:selenocysteine-specific elongation factor